MSITYGTATSERDLQQIIALQRGNHSSTISPEQAERDGFVTVIHSFDLLERMNNATPQVVAKDGEHVVGYALVMLESFKDMIPVLVPMFGRLSQIHYHNKAITDYTFYIMGQICVAEAYRGQGLFDNLYRKHRELHQAEYDLCITSVSTRNMRSMKAHERVGFKSVHTFRDSVDEWNILIWDWN